ARAVEETMVTQAGTVLGTLRYLAPEQAAGTAVGPPADVYSLGVVLDELLVAPTAADRALIARMRDPDPGRRPTAALAAPGAVHHRATSRAPFALVAAVVVAVAAAASAVALSRPSKPASVEPVPHATGAAQQARNLEAWLRRYSR